MPDTPFRSLSTEYRLDSLRFAAEKSGVQANLLEKDVWVVQVLATIFNSPFGSRLTFKGGTSLSKVYHAIERFSEDIDITYDIRALAPDLAAQGDTEPIPTDTRQGRRWKAKIEKLFDACVSEEAYPLINEGLSKYDAQFELEVLKDQIFVHYEPLSRHTGLVGPPVRVEFGARSTGEPHNEALVKCDAAVWLPDVEFPTANLQVMLAERTFWEKATAAHVFCLQKRQRGDRQSRHWYDLAALSEKGLADKALSDVETALRVARHKNVLFPENDSDKQYIDYLEAVSGKLEMVPEGEAYEILERDYQKMLDGGMVPDVDRTFQDLMLKCQDIQKEANSQARIDQVRSFRESKNE